MSFYDYKQSREIVKMDPPFYALIMAAMRKADDENIMLLRLSFPQIYTELQERYNAPGGLLGSEINGQ